MFAARKKIKAWCKLLLTTRMVQQITLHSYTSYDVQL